MAKRRYAFYEYEIANQEKFVNGERSVIVRSSWERDFAMHCDLLPNVVEWGYELVHIPYHDPLTNTQKIYIPDFFVTTVSHGQETKSVIEIKPASEQLDEYARNNHDAAMIARNRAKWLAAAQWCDRHGATFDVINETDLYTTSVKPRKHPVKGFAYTDPGTGKTKKAKPGKFKAPKSTTSTGTGVKKKCTRSAKTANSSGSVAKAGKVRKA